MKRVRVFGDKYLVRKTFDVVDYQGGVCGFDIFDENRQFFFHCDGDYEKEAISEIKWRVYKSNP